MQFFIQQGLYVCMYVCMRVYMMKHEIETIGIFLFLNKRSINLQILKR